MRTRGLFVQKLIQFFEGMHICECNFNERTPQNHENYEATTGTTESGMEPTLPNEAPSETDPPKATSSKATIVDKETLKSLPLLHSSVFHVPSLQMLFELVGHRTLKPSVLEMAELCHRLMKVVHILNHPLTINHSLGRSGCSLDDLTCLNRQRDVLDNVAERPPHCSCSFSTKPAALEEKKHKTCPRHRPTWPAPRGRTRVRRRSADEPTLVVRPFTAEKEALTFFGPPTLAELLQKEQNKTAEAVKVEPEVTKQIAVMTCEPCPVEPSIETTAAALKMEPEVTKQIAVMTCEPCPVDPSMETTAAALEDFNASVDMAIQDIQNSLSPQPSPLTAKEDGERSLPSPKTRSNRLKRKFIAKLPSTSNETDDRKITSTLARKRFLQQRLSKKEIRRARRFFRDSTNPSIYSQFCTAKGETRLSERIEWKSDRASKNRPISPNIDMWATLAERDSMLETSLYKCESEPTPPPPALPPKTTVADEIDLNKLFLKRLANIDPIVPCCCCSCHYRFTGIEKADTATDVKARMMDAETQTTSFASYDEPGIWSRRKESRTKSEGGIEKQPARHNVTKRFLDFINEQTSCMTGNKQQRANDKQERVQFHQFLLSRFLENGENHDAKPDQEYELLEPQKPRKE